MNEKIKTLSRLEEALEILVYSNVEEALESAGLTALIGRSIPEDVLRVYANTDYIKRNLTPELLGFETIDFQDIRKGVHPNRSLEKFAGDLITGHHAAKHSYFLIAGLEDDLIPDRELSDLEALFPLMHFEGSYMFYANTGDSQTHGIIAEHHAYGSLFAPSLEAHYLDLISGIKSGHYLLGEGEVYFPGSWHFRKKLEQGLVKMSKYGDVLDLDGNPI